MLSQNWFHFLEPFIVFNAPHQILLIVPRQNEFVTIILWRSFFPLFRNEDVGGFYAFWKVNKYAY